MAAISGILNHNTAAAQALAGTSATPMAASSSTNSTSSSAATISSNDFLTLLVTEMKNQDPTASTDPNEYINQLVNVNSLQQLISINQTLTADSTSGTKPVAHVVNTSSSPSGAAAQAQPEASSSAAGLPNAISAAAAKLAPGNLSLPAVNSAAQTVAQSLSGRPRVQ